MQISVFLFFGSRRKLVFGFEEKGIAQKSMVFIQIKVPDEEYFLTKL